MLTKSKKIGYIIGISVLFLGIQIHAQQTLIHYWNFNNDSSQTSLLTPSAALVSGASITHIAGGSSTIDVTGGTGQNFNTNNHNVKE